jgi:hypothetical protein
VRGKQRSADEARLVEVLRAAPERVEPPCQRYGLCGGCALQHMDSGAQVAAKQQQLLEELATVRAVAADKNAAVEAFASMAERFPKSNLADDALVAAARLTDDVVRDFMRVRALDFVTTDAARGHVHHTKQSGQPLRPSQRVLRY